ncbi:MAG: metallophosphoesterase family protein [Bacteroidota bacterium]
MIKVKKHLIFFSLLLLISCSQNPKSVKDVIDSAVSHIYNTVSNDELNTLTNEDVLNLFSEDELEILSTKYWMFDINTLSIVSIMLKEGQSVVPFWLHEKGFQKTELIVKNEYTTYEVWQKEFPAGNVGLGINGFDNQNRHYFVTVQAVDKSKELILSNFFPKNQFVSTMNIGSFTYHDWDELVLTEVPKELKGGKLLTTIRGRASEAYLINAFRETKFPSSDKPDQIMLTWSNNPETTQSIQWRTNTNSKNGVVRYWESELDKNTYNQVDAGLKTMEDRMLQNDRYINRYTAFIENLKSGTKYNYIVGNPNTESWSDISEFNTAPDTSAPFSFIYLGDIHRSPHSGELINNSYTRFPDVDFYTQGGDMVGTGLYRNDWDEFFEYSSDVLKNKSLMTVPGNHDDQKGLGAWMYADLFDLPDNGPENIPPEYTYSFNYGNALFLMIASTLPIKEQTSWIENELKNTDAKWKFVIFHFPPFSADEDYPIIRKNWGSLFDKYHVDIVFSGHVHYYMRSKPMYDEKVVKDPSQGTIYVISVALPGRKLELPEKDFVDIRYSAGDYYYQKIDITGNKLTYNTYNFKGEICDSLEIKKR